MTMTTVAANKLLLLFAIVINIIISRDQYNNANTQSKIHKKNYKKYG